MKLNVLRLGSGKSEPWYAGGLDFTCTQCGNCCTGGPGYVWITKEEVVVLAKHLGLTPQETVKRYCRRIEGKLSLKEFRTPEGNYDCVFLKEVPPDAGGGAGTKGVCKGKAVDPTQPRKVCTVYDVRPLQCRTWPFWEGNLTSRRHWERAGQRCHGIGEGRHFTREEIEAIRDAAEWPKDPPSSE